MTLLLLGTTLLARAAGAVESLGGNTYAITCEAKTAFNRNIEKLKTEARAAAAKYCADQGKQLKVISFVEEKPGYTLGYFKAKIIFKALEAGDADLTAPETPVVTAASATTVSGAPLPAVSGDFYSEMLKLDDLRKRGILTEKEFEQQKKKLLKKY